MRIVTDFSNCPDTLELEDGTRLTIVSVRDRRRMWAESRRADGVLLNGTLGTTVFFALGFLLFPWRRRPLIVADIVLRAPTTARTRVLRPFFRFVFGRVDHFIHFFHDVSGYDRAYGIDAARSSYAPFKSNISRHTKPSAHTTDGDYVFTMGVSLRDYDTFITAISRIEQPAAMPEYSFDRFENRPADFRWTRENLPSNLRLIPDSGSQADLIENMRGAKLVVVPTLRQSICASGISTYLDAMHLGKCVIVSEGPGASDVLTGGEAILVPPEDPDALARAIERAWNDDDLRRSVAERGLAYAATLGGEQEFLRRILSNTAGVIAGRLRGSRPS